MKKNLKGRCSRVGLGEAAINITEPGSSIITLYCALFNAPANIKVGMRGVVSFKMQRGRLEAVFTKT